MPDIIMPGESSLTDCPSVLGSNGYQAIANGSSSLCLPFELADGEVVDDYQAAFADIFCMGDKVIGSVEAGDGDCGLLLPVPDAVIDRPGIYMVQVAMMVDDRPTKVRTILLSVEPSLWTIGTDQQSSIGMLTIDQVRTQLRDTEGGTIVAGHEYSVNEIIHSLKQPIDYWNSVPPPGFVTFNGRTFPYTYHWLQATCANLMRISATWYLRQSKQMKYSGGLTTDDRDKYAQYLGVAESLWKNYEMFVRETKLSLIRNNGVVGLGSALPAERFGTAFPGY